MVRKCRRLHWLGCLFRRQTSSLPVVPKLAATRDASGVETATCDLAPFVAEIETGVETRPVIDAWRRRVGIWRGTTREISGGGRSRGCDCDSCHRDRQHLLFHLVPHSTPLVRVMQKRTN